MNHIGSPKEPQISRMFFQKSNSEKLSFHKLCQLVNIMDYSLIYLSHIMYIHWFSV